LGWLLAPLFGKLNGKSRCFILRRGHRYGQVRGTRREPRSAARPSCWRLCVRTHARQCLASNAPSPLGAHGRHPCRPNGPANLPTPLPTEMPGQSLKLQAKAGQHLRRQRVIDADCLSSIVAAAAIAPLRRPFHCHAASPSTSPMPQRKKRPRCRDRLFVYCICTADSLW